MEFTQLIQERYSCKKYKDTKISKEVLEEILNAGRLAPTAKNLQEQSIYIIESEEKLKVIDEMTPCRYGAPVVLVVAYDKNNVFDYPGGKVNSGTEDATIVATHLMLAAQNAGVNSCWINFFDPSVAKEKLGLLENEEVVMLLDLGYADEGGQPLANHTSRKDLLETVKYM